MNKRHGRVRVGPLDVEFAGARVWVLIGPTPADSSQYLAVLSRIAEGGPANRVGLQPRRDRRSWRFDPNLSPSVVAGDLDLDPSNVDAAMTQLAGWRVEQPVLAANLSGYLALCIDHGLGDAYAIAEIAAALTRPGAPLPGGYIPPQHDSNVARPLQRVARRVLTAGPVGVGRDLVHELNVAKARRSDDESREVVGASSDTGVPGHAVIFLRSRPGFLAAVREFRDARHGGVSAAALVFYALRQSLSCVLGDAGSALSGTTSLLADLRRYLNPGESTLANLSMVAHAVTPNGQSLQEFSASLARATGAHSSYPATRTLAGCALRALQPAGRQAGNELAAHSSGKVEVTFSDVSRLPSLRKFQYRRDSGGGGPITAVALPPGARNQLTIALATVGDELQLTATYYPDAVPTEALRSALERGLTLETLTAV